MTKALERQLPALGATDEMGGTNLVYVKYFSAISSWRWYGTEYNPSDRMFFGLVDGFELELGYFSLEELATFKGRWGLGIERDLHWTPRPLRELMAEIEVRRSREQRAA